MGACTAVSGTDGAAAVLDACAGVDAGAPDVALRALPPDIPAAARHDHFGRQLAVERRMPLGGNVGRGGREIVEAREHLASRAVGAALLARGAERDAHGKRVPLFAAPPCHRGAAAGNIVRRPAAVFLRIPLPQQRLAPVLLAELPQAFSHALTSLVRRNQYSVPLFTTEHGSVGHRINVYSFNLQLKKSVKRKNAHKNVVSKKWTFETGFFAHKNRFLLIFSVFRVIFFADIGT